MDMQEIWIVYCLFGGNGRAYIGVASSRKNANSLAKELYKKIDEEAPNDEFFEIIRRVKLPQGDFKKPVIDLT